MKSIAVKKANFLMLLFFDYIIYSTTVWVNLVMDHGSHVSFNSHDLGSVCLFGVLPSKCAVAGFVRSSIFCTTVVLSCYRMWHVIGIIDGVLLIQLLVVVT